jgi:hypothetical protein
MNLLWRLILLAIITLIAFSGTKSLLRSIEFALNEKVATGVVTSMVSEEKLKSQKPNNVVYDYVVSIKYDGYIKNFKYQGHMPPIGTKVNIFYSSNNPLWSYTDKKTISNKKDRSFWCNKDCLNLPYVLIPTESKRSFWVKLREYMDSRLIYLPIVLFAYLTLLGIPFIYILHFNKQKYINFCLAAGLASYIVILVMVSI